jgi:hypothetical protein
MKDARARYSSLLVVLLTLTACTRSSLSREDAESRAPDASMDAEPALVISRRDCARSRLDGDWVLSPHSECRSAADCSARPYGSCIGSPYERCEYPLRPGAPDDTCQSDMDCVAAIGGHCATHLGPTFCVYAPCRTDADCGVQGACLCSNEHGGDHYCVVEGCHGHAECGAGQRCTLDESISGAPPQWHCTTASDVCREKADCGAGDSYCGFDLEQHHWRCRPFTTIF